jgi:ribonuclease BN (tRNA processing enzyme)
MKLTFHGTRGYVDASSPSHEGHSAFTIEEEGFRLLCDFGENRKGMLSSIGPDAIVVSHAHPDHAWGLAEGTDAPVFASAETHDLLSEFPLTRRVRITPGKKKRAGPFRIALFPVLHSTRCPATAALLETQHARVLYSGDVVAFPEPEQAFPGVDLYVGDGSTLERSLVRRLAGGVLVGHTTVRAQLGWLDRFGVRRAIFSHFGTDPIAMGDDRLGENVRRLAEEKAPRCDASIASDGAVFLL